MSTSLQSRRRKPPAHPLGNAGYVVAAVNASRERDRPVSAAGVTRSRSRRTGTPAAGEPGHPQSAVGDDFSASSRSPLLASVLVPMAGELITETFDYDGGRQVTVYVPPDPPEAVVFAGDGQGISRWGGFLEAAAVPSTMIVGVHGLADEMLRHQEYSPVLTRNASRHPD